MMESTYDPFRQSGSHNSGVLTLTWAADGVLTLTWEADGVLTLTWAADGVLTRGNQTAS